MQPQLTLEKAPCEYARPSSLIGNFTSQEPTIFWILKSWQRQAPKSNSVTTSSQPQYSVTEKGRDLCTLNFAGNPSFWMIRAYWQEEKKLAFKWSWSRIALLFHSKTSNNLQPRLNLLLHEDIGTFTLIHVLRNCLWQTQRLTASYDAITSNFTIPINLQLQRNNSSIENQLIVNRDFVRWCYLSEAIHHFTYQVTFRAANFDCCSLLAPVQTWKA